MEAMITVMMEASIEHLNATPTERKGKRPGRDAQMYVKSILPLLQLNRNMRELAAKIHIHRILEQRRAGQESVSSIVSKERRTETNSWEDSHAEYIKKTATTVLMIKRGAETKRRLQNKGVRPDNEETTGTNTSRQ